MSIESEGTLARIRVALQQVDADLLLLERQLHAEQSLAPQHRPPEIPSWAAGTNDDPPSRDVAEFPSRVTP